MSADLRLVDKKLASKVKCISNPKVDLNSSFDTPLALIRDDTVPNSFQDFACKLTVIYINDERKLKFREILEKMIKQLHVRLDDYILRKMSMRVALDDAFF